MKKCILKTTTKPAIIFITQQIAISHNTFNLYKTFLMGILKYPLLHCLFGIGGNVNSIEAEV